MAVDEAPDAFAAYAAAHGFTLEPGIRLPRTTPLLAEGELRSVDALMRGWLAKFLEAQIGVVTREGAGAEGRPAHLIVAVTHVPKAKRFVPWMLCHRIEDEGVLGRAAEELIRGNDRVELESAELDRRYRIYAAPQRNDIWLHELFAPSFITFLLELAPRGLAFEYVEGTLCVSLVGAGRLDEELDAVCEATIALVGRIREQIRESLGPAAGRSAPGASG